MAPHRLVSIGPCKVFVGVEARTGPRWMAKRAPCKGLRSGSHQARRRTSTGPVRFYAHAQWMMQASIAWASIRGFQTETGFFHFFNSLRRARSKSRDRTSTALVRFHTQAPCVMFVAVETDAARGFSTSRPEKQESASNPHHLASALGMDIIASWHHTDWFP